MLSTEEYWMRRAIRLALKGTGRTTPNPVVGCVIVRNGMLVGEGWHRRAGGPHAEIHALKAAGDAARGADLYVTLEPCCHYGKTPPCVLALQQSGPKRVFVGMTDPNPLVCGQGIRQLQDFGMEVITGVLQKECRQINLPYLKHLQRGLPFVTLKSALTLDGKIAAAGGDSRWVTGEKARRWVHRLRARHDGIMVGVGTILADDPQLTCRLPGCRSPHRIIVDSRLRIPPTARVLQPTPSAKTYLATLENSAEKGNSIFPEAVELLVCREKNGQVDLLDLMQQLDARGIQSLLLEGGAGLAGSMLREKRIDHCMLFYAPKLIGGEGIGLFSGPGACRMGEAVLLRSVTVKRMGNDFLIQGEPDYSCLPD